MRPYRRYNHCSAYPHSYANYRQPQRAKKQKRRVPPTNHLPSAASVFIAIGTFLAAILLLVSVTHT